MKETTLSTPLIQPDRIRTSIASIAAGLLLLAVVTTPAAAEPGDWTAELRADSDNSGVVDDRDETSEDAGAAIFLPNLDDDQNRCREKGKGKKGKKFSNKKLDRCHDAADEKVNGPLDELDLAPIVVLAQPDVPADARATLSLSRPGKTRLFVRNDAGWSVVDKKSRIGAAELREGLQLGLEGRDINRDRSDWDGRTQLTLSVEAGGEVESDSVQFRVAPMLSHHPVQAPEEVMVIKAKEKKAAEKKNKKADKKWGKKFKVLYGGSQQPKFNASLSEATAGAGVPGGVRELRAAGDPWVQDFFEPMYASMPSGDEAQTMRLLLRSDQARAASRSLYRLRGRDTGVVWMGKQGKGSYGNTLSSMGNFETIPPYSHDGADYPAGRIIMGTYGKGRMKPSARVLEMLRAQGVQKPLMLDTSFLSVGHVDEFIQFLPADNEFGWRVAVADPQAGLDLLRTADRMGKGGKRLINNKWGSKLTVAEALGKGSKGTKNKKGKGGKRAKKGLIKANLRAARIIEENLDKVKAATGVTEADVVRVPMLFKNDRYQPKMVKKQIKAGKPNPETVMVAAVPGAVNNLVLGDRLVVPRGSSRSR